MKKLYFLFTLLTISLSFGQTNVFTVAGGGAFPTGWVGTNNVTTNAIDRGTYYLLDAGSPGDLITTSSYDLSTYGSAVLDINVATFGSGTSYPATIEVSYDGGSTYTDTFTTATPTSSTYIAGGPIVLSSVSSQVVIKISHLGASGRGVRLQNIKLDGYGTDPQLTITSPSNATLFNPLTSSVNVSLSIINFSVANGSGDGYIKYSVNGGTAVDKFDTADINIPVTQGGSYSVYVELVDNSGNPLSTPINDNVVFSVDVIYVMSDLASLRADVVTNGAGRYYQINSTPTITYARASRNQKYIQDATAAIVIDDSAGTITVGVQGDGLTGLVGQTFDFNGLLEFVPAQDASVAPGSPISAQVVTITDVLATPEAYESKLLQINGVTFDATNTTFAANTNVPVTAPTATTFRPIFSEADYIGQNIPTSATNIICFAGQSTPANVPTTNEVYFVARSLADLTLETKSFNAIDGLKMYPNPLTGNILNFSSNANAAMTVQVYDVLGKEVVKGNVTNNTFNTGNLNAGIYIVKITEEGKTATRKLVVK